MSETTKRQAAEWFGGGRLLCAETVLRIMADAAGRELGGALGAASGLCSGVARTKGRCGALNGAIMGLGLLASDGSPEAVRAQRETVYDLVQELLAWFRDAFGATNCFELTGCDFLTPEGRDRYRGQGVRKTCEALCAEAAGAALDLLREAGMLPAAEDTIRDRLAPCGLSCGDCVAFAGGPVQRSAMALAAALGDNFGAYAERFTAMNPVFGDYAAFRRLLDHFAGGTCRGCRESGCLFADCRVTACVREQGVDYCFQCAAFPCDRHGMPPSLAERWRQNNAKMAEIGVEAWWDGCRVRPRYP